MAVEPLAMWYPGLAGGTLRGRLTPRFRTIQVCPKSAARKHAQALALSKGHIPRLWPQKAFSGSVKTGPPEIPVGLPLKRALVWRISGMGIPLRARPRRDDPRRASRPAARRRERASRCRSRGSSYALTRRSDVRFREQTGKHLLF